MGGMSGDPYRAAGRCWASLKRNPGIHARDLAHLLQWTKERTTKYLSRLRTSGFARHSGYQARNTQWYAIGDMRPENRWGAHPNSLANLDEMKLKWRETLRMAFVARGTDPDRLGQGKPRRVRPRSECALADCWKMPSSPTPAGD